MSEQPYMQLWIADFIGDTLHLSSDEIGQYMLILMAMWRAGGYLANDEIKLARIARGRVSEAVMGFLTICQANGTVCQKRLLAELEKARTKSAARSVAGKAGAEAKALKNKEPAQANAKAKAHAKVKHLSESESESESLATNVARESASKRARGFPEKWIPENLLSYQEPEFEKFRDHFLANGKLMKNWDAAWRNWLRRAPEFSGPRKEQTSGRKQHLYIVESPIAKSSGCDEDDGQHRKAENGRIGHGLDAIDHDWEFPVGCVAAMADRE